MKKLGAMCISLMMCTYVNAQSYSDDVTVEAQDGNTVVLTASAVDAKKKDAETLAIKSAFNALMHTGLEGLKSGTPMVATANSSYDYRLFSESRYVNYLTEEPKTVSTMKIGGKTKATVRVSINCKTFMSDLQRNNIAVNPSWSDAKAANATSALNPSIVVVPYVKGSNNDFNAMRDLIDKDTAVKHALTQIAREFTENGYKTRNFVTWLQNSSNEQLLHSNSQSDINSKVVEMLSADIVVTVDVTVTTNASKQSECVIVLDATEAQTAGSLANSSLASGKYMTTDAASLVDHAIKKIKKDFFNQISAQFDQMVQKGREINLVLTLSDGVSDWDFEQEAPQGSDYFKDALDEWLRANSYRGVYEMDRSTDKYIRATVNIPLWNAEKNRSYSLSNFGSDLKKFLRSQFGDMYKANVTAMGQKLDVVIE